MTAAAGSSSRVWRPSMSRYLGFARVGMVVVGVVAVAEVVLLSVWRSAAFGALPAAVVIVGTGSVALGSQVVRIRRVRVSLDEDWLTWRGVFNSVRMRRESVRGALAPIKQPMSAPTTMLLLSDGSRRVRLVAGLWDEVDLSDIADQLGLATSPDSLTQKQVEAQAPGATTAFGRHPWRAGLGIAGLILAGTAVTSVLLVLLDHPAPRPARGPARVSADTVSGQTRELAHLENAFHASGWPTPRTALWACTDDADRPGWQRHLETTNSTAGPHPRRAAAGVESLLRAAGYDVTRSDRDDAATIDGERDTATDAATVEVIIVSHTAGIDLTSGCEI